MIAYRDFLPPVTNVEKVKNDKAKNDKAKNDKTKNDDEKGFWRGLTQALGSQPPEFGTLDDIMVTVNEWLHLTEHEVINIETVVVPTIAAGTSSAHLRAQTWEVRGVQQVTAFQFVRVWYRMK